MPDFSVYQWLTFFAAAFLVSLAKTGIPGIGITAVVLVASAMDAKASVGFLLPVLIMGDVFAVAYYRRHAVWSHLARLMPPAFVGIVIGHFVMLRIGDGNVLKPVIGGIVLLMLALDWLRLRRGNAEVPQTWWFAAIIGVLAGVTTMLANAAGPLILIYFLAMRFDKERFIGTAAWYFLVLNCVKVPFFIAQDIITWRSFMADLVLLPGVLLGAVAGIIVLKRIPQRWFVGVVKVLTALAALKFIIG